MELDSKLRASKYATSTRAYRAKALRQILRWLWENHGAPKLDSHVRRYASPRPRNVTVTEQEREALFAAAPPHMRLWLLLCSDLAIRSGTAIALGPRHFNTHTGTLTFTTKYDERLTLPATAEIRALIATCDTSDPLSFVRQLWQRQHHADHMTGRCTTLTADALRHSYTRMRKRLGITRKLVPHDFRRTTAVAMLRHSGDIRDVQAVLGHRSLQSTIWYLDHDLRPVKRASLELIKTTNWRKEQIA